MKNIYMYVAFIMFIFGCTKFSEDIDTAFSSAENVKITDLNTSFPVINLELDKDEFDNMYANFEEEIEIEAVLSLYRNNSLEIEEEKVELEIKGSSSAAFSLKSLGVKFDKTFDNKERKLLNPSIVLPNHSLDKIKAVRLRNSGNDFKETLLKDISYTQLAISAGLDIELMYFEPAIVFVNNSFLGLMNLRSEANRNGMYRLNKADKDDITLAKIENPGIIVKKNGDFDRIDQLFEAIEIKNTAFLKEEIDLNNFIDYVIFQTHIANIDWPYNNVRLYSVKDKPFRFILFDLDRVNTRQIENHPLTFIQDPYSVNNEEAIKNPITDLFNILYADTDFKNTYDNRYEELLKNNAFSFSKFNQIIDDNFNAINKYMPLHIDKYSDINSMIEWYRNIELLKAEFKKREEILEKLL